MSRTLMLIASLLFVASPLSIGRAQTASDVEPQVFDGLSSDLKNLVINIPVWMASHVPAMMPWTGNGAGIDMDRDGGDFSIGINLARIGVMNQFSQVGAGTEFLDLETSLPGLFPWPQFGVNVGVSLGAGFEIGADVMFLPEMDLNPMDGVSVGVEFFQASVGILWRINEASAALPSFGIIASGSIYHGNLEIGANHQEPYTFETDVNTPQGPQKVTTEGNWRFFAGPDFNWTFYQVNLELRASWDVTVFRPYLGLGFGMTFGETGTGASFSAEATIERVAGQPTSGTTNFQERIEYSTPAAQYMFRPLLGFDIVAGLVAINLQMELSVVEHDNVNTDVGQAAESLDPSQDLPFNKAKDSETSAAFVASLGVRFQF